MNQTVWVYRHKLYLHWYRNTLQIILNVHFYTTASIWLFFGLIESSQSNIFSSLNNDLRANRLTISCPAVVASTRVLQDTWPYQFDVPLVQTFHFRFMQYANRMRMDVEVGYTAAKGGLQSELASRQDSRPSKAQRGHGIMAPSRWHADTATRKRDHVHGQTRIYRSAREKQEILYHNATQTVTSLDRSQ